MAPNLLFYQLLLVALVLICLPIHVEWPDNPRATSKLARKPDKPRRKRSKAPKPFTGLIHKPLCEACEQGADAPPKRPGTLPPVRTFTRGRWCTVDTAQHFCPDHDCAYHGWLRQRLALFHVYHNFVLPHASLRQLLLVPEPTNGLGSAKVWRPSTPAMAAWLTDHVWSLKEGLLFRVPPWPQPQIV